MQIGDTAIVAEKYEGFVVEFDRYGRKGTVCVYINWDGDGVYCDYYPKDVKVVPIQDIRNPSMRRDAMELRQKQYRKGEYKLSGTTAQQTQGKEE